jgi:hypothetical protein
VAERDMEGGDPARASAQAGLGGGGGHGLGGARGQAAASTAMGVPSHGRDTRVNNNPGKISTAFPSRALAPPCAAGSIVAVLQSSPPMGSP